MEQSHATTHFQPNMPHSVASSRRWTVKTDSCKHFFAVPNMSNNTFYQPFVVSNAILPDHDALRERMREDGYLFFQRLLDPEEIFAIRKDILTVFRDKGWVNKNDMMDGIASAIPTVEGEPEFFEAHDEVYKLEKFHTFAHNPILLHVTSILVNDVVFCHPLHVVRMMFPQNVQQTTPPHQDYPNNQGSENVYAAWIPLGDCPVGQGALAIQKGSHKFGVLPLKPSPGAGRWTVIYNDEVEKQRWISSDFCVGDFVVFSSKTIHKARKNLSKDRFRLSVDYRYQGQSEPICERSLQPHFRRLSWDQIYSGWESEKYQYYWRSMDLRVVPYNQEERSKLEIRPDKG